MSGPHCGRALAQLGADVIKLEPAAGDYARSQGFPVGSASSFYIQQNEGKRNLCLDLYQADAVAVVRKLLPTVDVVIENFRPGVMDEMGLGAAACQAINPRLVYASITGWGQQGPESQRPAFAIIVAAEAGLTERVNAGLPDELHRNDPYAHPDVYAGLHCVAGVLAALFERHATGRGRRVDISMMSSAVSVNEFVAVDLNHQGQGAPYINPPLFRHADGSVVMVADFEQDLWFGRFVEIEAAASLRTDERFVDAGARRAHRRELSEAVQAVVETFATFDELESAARNARIAIGLVRTLADVADRAWTAERPAVMTIDDRVGGTYRLPASPWRFDATGPTTQGRLATRGEHNRELLVELGLDPAEIEDLRRRGVVTSE
jgi:crotonobetainyl-CoA:carnitine CoA-transferase CaiB-like acyl-CoA transferase